MRARQLDAACLDDVRSCASCSAAHPERMGRWASGVVKVEVLECSARMIGNDASGLHAQLPPRAVEKIGETMIELGRERQLPTSGCGGMRGELEGELVDDPGEQRAHVGHGRGRVAPKHDADQKRPVRRRRDDFQAIDKGGSRLAASLYSSALSPASSTNRCAWNPAARATKTFSSRSSTNRLRAGAMPNRSMARA